MKLIPVSLAVFYEELPEHLRLWVQVREDGGPFKGLLEFPGGGIEEGETPLAAAVREVEEEVGLVIDPALGRFVGTYPNLLQDKTILLYVYLFPKYPELDSKGEWLSIGADMLSGPYRGKIPYPNHQIIDDLFRSLLLK